MQRPRGTHIWPQDRLWHSWTGQPGEGAGLAETGGVLGRPGPLLGTGKGQCPGWSEGSLPRTGSLPSRPARTQPRSACPFSADFLSIPPTEAPLTVTLPLTPLSLHTFLFTSAFLVKEGP